MSVIDSFILFGTNNLTSVYLYHRVEYKKDTKKTKVPFYYFFYFLRYFWDIPRQAGRQTVQDLSSYPGPRPIGISVFNQKPPTESASAQVSSSLFDVQISTQCSAVHLARALWGRIDTLKTVLANRYIAGLSKGLMRMNKECRKSSKEWNFFPNIMKYLLVLYNLLRDVIWARCVLVGEIYDSGNKILKSKYWIIVNLA